jgi:hypothetical protein
LAERDDEDQVEIELHLVEEGEDDLPVPATERIPGGPVVGERVVGTQPPSGLSFPQLIALRREGTRNFLGGVIVLGYLVIAVGLVLAAALRNQLPTVGVPVLTAATGIVATVAGFYFGERRRGGKS